ncbi:Competence protein CoiA-like family protein [Streptococcus parasanguinis]|uniref:Competence protein CoiA-like family protein n=1 Tax=Streptococcus parasanguinis TaxID=1318 RepID=A0A6N2ZFC6_STRPA
MFIAMDKDQQRWNCIKEVPPTTAGPFYCLACHSQVRLKNGSVLRPHFAHVELQHCPYHHEAESFEHLELKASLYDWASKESKTEVESYLADFQQIADLLLVDKNLALEVQCSSLSLERLKERSDAYRAHGYQVYWLLGKKLWLKERLTKLQAGFLYFSQNRGFHLWELDLTKKELRLQYLIHEDLRGRLHYQTEIFPFGQRSLLEVLRTPYLSQPMQQMAVELDRTFLTYIQQQLFYRHPKWMKLQEELYLQGHHLLEKDLDYFYPLCRPIVSDYFIQIEGDLKDYYKRFLTYYKEQGIKPVQTLYSPCFYKEQKR